MAEFRMPSLGADMEAATVVEWLVAPGDTLQEGQIVAVVETTKGAIEIEIFAGGVVEEILVPVGSEVPVGTALMRYRSAGAAPKAAAPPASTAPPAAAPERPAPAPASPAPAAASPPSSAEPPPPGASAPPARPPVSPAARRRAAELDVDPTTLRGTGVDGAVTIADVERAAGAAAAPDPAPAATPPPPEPAPPARDRAAMRQTIATAMARSKREIPHYYLDQDVDLAPALAWLEAHNAELPIAERVLPAALLYRAAALALSEVPELNGTFQNDAFVPADHVDLALVISLGREGLVIPTIPQAEQRPLSELMAALYGLSERARSGRLRGSDLGAASCTVTSLGIRGVDRVLGVIYPPQVALVGFGRIAPRAWAVGDAVGVHPVVTASVAGDHRVSDGFHGARLLHAIEDHLHHPEAL